MYCFDSQYNNKVGLAGSFNTYLPEALTQLILEINEVISGAAELNNTKVTFILIIEGHVIYMIILNVKVIQV